jgi:hypothetical protein
MRCPVGWKPTFTERVGAMREVRDVGVLRSQTSFGERLAHELLPSLTKKETLVSVTWQVDSFLVAQTEFFQ